MLAQTPSPGITIPQDCTVQQLTDKLGIVGADLLVQGLRDGVHIPPVRDAGWKAKEMGGEGEQTLMHAPKLTKAAAEVDWTNWTHAQDWTRRMRVFGSLWTTGVTQGRAGSGPGKEKRVLFLDAQAVDHQNVKGDDVTLIWNQGQQIVKVDEASGHCFVPVGGVDGAWVRLTRAKVDGKGEQSASSALRPFRRR